MPGNSPEISLVLPCYNEMEHIETSLKKISGYLEMFCRPGTYEIILVDDGSKDGTRDFLKKLGDTAPYRIELNEKNMGRGGTVKKGLRLARGKIMGFMDIDCEVSESYLPVFVQNIREGADLAVAWRTYSWSFQPWVLSRHLASVGYRKITELPLGNPVHDSEAGYKFFSSRARDAILELSHFDNWFWDTEVVHICKMSNLEIREVPVLFIRNPTKTSTVNLVRDTAQYLRAIARFKQLLRQNAYRR